MKKEVLLPCVFGIALVSLIPFWIGAGFPLIIYQIWLSLIFVWIYWKASEINN